MRVRARPADRIQIGRKSNPNTRPATDEKEYEVHAIQICPDGVPFFQFVDDLGYPSWLPYVLFDVVEHHFRRIAP